MTSAHWNRKYCIIGAGASGIAAAKNLKQLGIICDVIEREDNVGGNWYFNKPNSSIYRSVHLISSTKYTQFDDFPIPSHYPTYLNHEQACEYLRSYAREFGIYDLIEFGRSVEKVEREEEDGSWKVTLDGGETRRYGGLIVANGHLWKPRFPDYPGKFNGLALHSGEYKTPDVFKDKRVLVVGAGNSGCDIAVESCLHARKTLHSTRRGYYYYPKYMFGFPADVVFEFTLRLGGPMFLRRFFGKLMVRLNSAGDPAWYGLPKPDQKLFQEHIVINSTLLYHLGHGEITPRPDVKELCGDRVRFADGSEEPVDVIVYATGFHLSEFPFMDKKYLNWNNGRPELYLNVFHPRYDNLFFIGRVQTNTGNWPLMDYQSQLVARFVHAQAGDAAKAAMFRKLKAGPAPELSPVVRGLDSPRYAIEVEHFSYRARLRKLIAKMAPARQRSSGERVAGAQPKEA